MFLGLEAIDDEGLKHYRKRVTLSKNFEALEFARSLDITVAVNIIADPSWDRERFKVVRDWCLEIPEVVNISINTPYPGTETWHTESRRLTTRDYRLFDIEVQCCRRSCRSRSLKELGEQPCSPANIWAGRRCGSAQEWLFDTYFVDKQISFE